MVGKFYDPIQLKLVAIRVQLKTLLINYVRPTAQKMMGIHSGTNDITNKVNTLQKIRKVINAVQENDVNDESFRVYAEEK